MLFWSSRASLSQRIVPPKQRTAPTFPNFFLGIKGLDGTPAGARRQILHDSLLGAWEEKSHCERTGSFGVSILDNGFIFTNFSASTLWATSGGKHCAPDSDEELSPTRPSREVKGRRMNNFQLIQLFVYGNGRQIDGRPRTRTFDTTEEGGRRCTGFKAIQVEIVNIGTRQLFDPCVGLVTAFGKFTRYMPTLIAQCSSSAGHVCTTHWSS